MKLLILIVLLCADGAIAAKNVTINHQGRFFLRNVNEARKYLASGLLRQLEPLGLGLLPLPPVGPAANMYRMKWSMELETVARKNLNSGLKSPCGNYKKDGYSGFYWQNDLTQALKKYIKDYEGGIYSFGLIEKALKMFSSAFETLLFIVWAMLTYPRKFPIPNGTDIGPAEALYAHRYEMGCAFDEFALCLMRDTSANGTLYKEGVACTQCPTHCEFTENIDGTIEEGDLCVPPEPGSDLHSKMEVSAEMQEFIDTSSRLYLWISFLPLFLYI